MKFNFSNFIKTTPQGHCGLTFYPNGLAICAASPESGSSKLGTPVFKPYENQQSHPGEALSECVEALGLQGYSCNWVLSPHQYKLLLVEAPDVPKDELASAARWRVKDYLDYSLDDALIDVFSIPKFGAGENRHMMYVVAARLSELQPTVEMINASGLNLTGIDINELALRNITHYLPENQQGLALVYLNEKHSGIFLGHHDNIYLSRTLRFDGFQGRGVKEKSLETLVLEIQRSYDYYLSQLGQPEPSKLYLVPMSKFQNRIEKYIKKELAIPVEVIDLNKIFVLPTEIGTKEQELCITAMGGVLSREVAA